MAESFCIMFKVQPNAKKSSFGEWVEQPGQGWVLQMRLAAPPIDGKANACLIDFLRKQLNLPTGHVTLKRGQQSRLKLVEFSAMSPALQQLLDSRP